MQMLFYIIGGHVAGRSPLPANYSDKVLQNYRFYKLGISR